MYSGSLVTTVQRIQCMTGGNIITLPSIEKYFNIESWLNVLTLLFCQILSSLLNIVDKVD